MKPQSIHPAELNDQCIGALITRDLRTNNRTYRKGHPITADDLADLRDASQRIHLVTLEEGDIAESAAVARIVDTIRGEQTHATAEVQGRVNLRSTVRGLLRIDTEHLWNLNRLPEMGVFTMPDGIAVNAETLIAGVKIAPVAMKQADLDAALLPINQPIVDVLPFQPLRVTCIVTEQIDGRVRDRFEQSLQQKIAWYGGSLQEIVWVDEQTDAVAQALREAIPASDLVLAAGSHMMDPLDATILALDEVDARLVRLGAPAHPGSMVWLAHHDATDTPILSLASCSMYSRTTTADLLLPFLFARVSLTSDDIARLGHGGLLDRGMDWRFPPYESDE